MNRLQKMSATKSIALRDGKVNIPVAESTEVYCLQVDCSPAGEQGKLVYDMLDTKAQDRS
jgi:hypothetical protein